MQRMKSANQDYRPPSQWTMEGYLYVQEKREYNKCTFQLNLKGTASKAKARKWSSQPDNTSLNVCLQTPAMAPFQMIERFKRKISDFSKSTQISYGQMEWGSNHL